MSTRRATDWLTVSKTIACGCSDVYGFHSHPSQPGLEWKPYTKENPQAMVFDTVSQSVALRDDTLVSLLPPAGGPPAAPAGRGAAPAGR